MTPREGSTIVGGHRPSRVGVAWRLYRLRLARAVNAPAEMRGRREAARSSLIRPQISNFTTPNAIKYPATIYLVERGITNTAMPAAIDNTGMIKLASI